MLDVVVDLIEIRIDGVEDARFHIGRTVGIVDVHGADDGAIGPAQPVWSLAIIAGMRLEGFCAAPGQSCGWKALDSIF